MSDEINNPLRLAIRKAHDKWMRDADLGVLAEDHILSAVRAHLLSEASVERVAVTMASAADIPADEALQYWRDLDDESRAQLRHEARAAIAALVGEGA
jgi:hypothetical protein